MVDNVNDLMKLLNDPDTIAKYNEIAMANNKLLEENKKKVLTDNYMNWLCDFISSNGFASDSTSFPTNLLKDLDSENLKLLDTLFYLVDEYAYNNYYSSDNNIYNVVYDDTVIELRLFDNQGGMIFARKIHDPKSSIKFEDIVNHKDNEKKVLIDNKLKEFKKYTRELLDVVPLFALENAYETVIKEHYNEKTKKHIKD
jgi:hypothetical protein